MTGRKDDDGKLRYDLIPARAEAEIVAVLTHGAEKYGEENWRQVPDGVKRYHAAARRHIAAWVLGERLDPDTGQPHLAHAACCILFLLELTREPKAKRQGGDVQISFNKIQVLERHCGMCRHDNGGGDAPCLDCDAGLSRWEPRQ